MSQKKDLEEIFVSAVEKNHVPYYGKIFSYGDAAFSAHYIFGDSIVVVMDRHCKTKLSKIQCFKKNYSRFNVIILTNNCEGFIKDKYISEIYDGNSIVELIKKLKSIEK